MSKENTVVKEGYTEVYVFPGGIITHQGAKAFEDMIQKNFGVHVQYLEDIAVDTQSFSAEQVEKELEEVIGPEIEKAINNGLDFANAFSDLHPHGRSDALVAVHDDDRDIFAIQMMLSGAPIILLNEESWQNGGKEVYPERIHDYIK